MKERKEGRKMTEEDGSFSPSRQRIAGPTRHYMTRAQITEAHSRRLRLWVLLLGLLLAHAWGFVGAAMVLAPLRWGFLLIAGIFLTLLLTAITCTLVIGGALNAIVVGEEGE